MSGPVGNKKIRVDAVGIWAARISQFVLVMALALTVGMALALTVGTALAPHASAAPISVKDKTPMGARVRAFKDICGAAGGGQSIIVTDDDTGKVSGQCDGGAADGYQCTYTKTTTTCGWGGLVVEPPTVKDGSMANPGSVPPLATEGSGVGSDQAQVPDPNGASPVAHRAPHKHHKPHPGKR